MKSHPVKKIENLEDIFFAVLGGEPETNTELREFVESNPLGKLLYNNDIDRVLYHDGYFAEEVVDSVYAVLPYVIPLVDDQQFIMRPQTFRKLNYNKSKLPGSTLVDVSFPRALEVYERYFNHKVGVVIELTYEASVNKKAQERKVGDARMSETPWKNEQSLESYEEELRREKKRQYEKKHRENAMRKSWNKKSNNTISKKSDGYSSR